MQRGALTQLCLFHSLSGEATAIVMLQENKIKPRLRKFEPVI